MRDIWGRVLNYIRISVTDRCNYRCRYCMPEGGVEWISHDKILSYEEIFFLIGILCDLGIQKIRFTGGEPLVRKGMARFLGKVTASFPKLQVALTTNGSTLMRDAPSLVSAGLTSINISLDTLDPEKFSAVTRGASLSPVLEGIGALTSLVPRGKTAVKMNTVLMRGFNDDGMIGQLIDFAFKNDILLRFIEFMPLHSDLWSEERFMPFSDVLAKHGGRWAEDKAEIGLTAGPARYYVNAGTGQRIGMISAVSRHFCGTCNRLRVTSTGFVRPCLFGSGQVAVAEALKNRDDKRTRELLREAAAMKPAAGAVAPETGASAGRARKTHMHTIGG